MSFPPLLPDDRQTTPADDLAAAVQGAVTVSDAVTPAPEPAPLPFGSSWLFDFETGQFVRTSGAPAGTTGLDSLAQWCLMAIHSARFAHPVFSDEFGMENPEEPIGELAQGEILADWQRHLIDALLVHDRVTSVENVDLSWDPSTGILTIRGMDVVTDEDQTLTMGDVSVQMGG